MYLGIPKQCHSCILSQAQTAADFAGLNEKDRGLVLDLAKNEIDKSIETKNIVQHIIRKIADEIIRLLNESKDYDIYKDVKVLSNKIALNYLGKLKNKVKKSSSPLETAIQLSAAGNIIDFGAKSHGSIDIEKEIREIDNIGFKRYDLKELKEELIKAETLLFICDNSGEIVFDTLLIECIKKLYPKIIITVAVREKPIINDATLKDAQISGMTKLVDVISSGSVYPGTILNETTNHFQNLYRSADVIISKGQGNFETLSPIADHRLFFLLRIKCDYMASLSNVKKNNLVLMQMKRI